MLWVLRRRLMFVPSPELYASSLPRCLGKHLLFAFVRLQKAQTDAHAEGFIRAIESYRDSIRPMMADIDLSS